MICKDVICFFRKFSCNCNMQVEPQSTDPTGQVQHRKCSHLVDISFDSFQYSAGATKECFTFSTRNSSNKHLNFPICAQFLFIVVE